jgi:predicted RNA-binding Zn ribbon-like protein
VTLRQHPVNCFLMETERDWSSRPPEIRALPVVSGHLALDFANTVDNPGGHEEYDHVADYRGLLGWSLRVSLLGEDTATALWRTAEQRPGEAASVVQRAAALRAALNETFGAVVEGRPPSGGWEQLRAFVLAALDRAAVTSAPVPLRMTWEFGDLESPLWPVAAAAHQLLTAPDLRRLKRCAGCPWLFLDSSKNGSRRWCSMDHCGTHAKIQRYVSRRAARRRSPAS